MPATGSTDSGLGTRCWSQSEDLGTPGLSAEVNEGISVPVTEINYGIETACAAKKDCQGH